MIRKFVCLAGFALLALTTSCKKEDASSKIDASAVDVPPASPDAIEPDVMVGGPEVSDQTPAANVTTPPANGKFPVMSFGKSEHDFGTIKEGDKVDYTFDFKNSGESDLIITDAKGSCGCTVPEFPKDPIKPGKSGKIKVSFNSAGKPGMQSKTVTITTNTATGKEILTIKSSVTPKAQ